MLTPELREEGEHLMTVCNSCRYCEGFCAVWKAMETRLAFEESDLTYLANLCHNCGECFYACQYSPPHEFAIDPPRTLAKIRVASYEMYAWPNVLARAFRFNGLVVTLLITAFLAACMIGGSLMLGGRLFEPVRNGNFYAVIPHGVMTITFMTVGSFAAIALIIGFLRFWKNVGESYKDLAKPGALAQAARDVFTLVNLDNGGDGCSYPTEKSSQALRWLHHATFYGFLSCFVATTLGAVLYYGFGDHGPPGYFSSPVIFGTVGGIGLVIGPIGLGLLMRRRNPELVDRKQNAMDLSFIFLLVAISVTGLALLALRGSAALGTLLIVHLSLVMTLFLTMPYGKFVHGIYRSGALLKWSLERARTTRSETA